MPNPGSGGLPSSLPGFPSGGGVSGTGSRDWRTVGLPQAGGTAGVLPGGLPGLPGAPGTGGGFGAAPPLNNTVTPSADIKELQDLYRKRLTNDPTQRAIDRSTSNIRDSTSGLMKELGGNMARRGISQSGIQTSGQQALAGQAQRQIAGSSADISLGRERDLDALTMGGLPIMTAQDELGLRKQGLGLQQWQAQNQAEIARQQLGLQAQAQAQQGQQAMMSLWSQYLNMFR